MQVLPLWEKFRGGVLWAIALASCSIPCIWQTVFTSKGGCLAQLGCGGALSCSRATPGVLYTLWAVSVTGLGQEQVEGDAMFGVQVVESKCGTETKFFG